MSQIISHNSHDYMPVTILQVIASFSDDGHVKPLYVRINGETCKVASYWVRCQFSNLMDFHCKLIVGDFLQPVVITYHINECIWTVPKDREGD